MERHSTLLSQLNMRERYHSRLSLPVHGKALVTFHLHHRRWTRRILKAPGTSLGERIETPDDEARLIFFVPVSNHSYLFQGSLVLHFTFPDFCRRSLFLSPILRFHTLPC